MWIDRYIHAHAHARAHTQTYICIYALHIFLHIQKHTFICKIFVASIISYLSLYQLQTLTININCWRRARDVANTGGINNTDKLASFITSREIITQLRYQCGRIVIVYLNMGGSRKLLATEGPQHSDILLATGFHQTCNVVRLGDDQGHLTSKYFWWGIC